MIRAASTVGEPPHPLSRRCGLRGTKNLLLVRDGARRCLWSHLGPRSLSEKQCSKRYASLVECKDANYSTTRSRLL